MAGWVAIGDNKFAHYGGQSTSCFNDLRTFNTNYMEWKILLVDGVRNDLIGRCAHVAGSFGRFMVAFAGQGTYEHKIRRRQLFNDIVIFDTEKADYIKFEGNAASVVTAADSS